MQGRIALQKLRETHRDYSEIRTALPTRCDNGFHVRNVQRLLATRLWRVPRFAFVF